MSRNNVHYWNLCTGVIGEYGYCKWHFPEPWRIPIGPCYGPREIQTRRGIYKRGPRYKFGGHHHWPPPRFMKRYWERKLRALYKLGLRQHPDDPDLTDGDKLLRGWHQWWD